MHSIMRLLAGAAMVGLLLAGCVFWTGGECPTETFSTTPAAAIILPGHRVAGNAVGACPANVEYGGVQYRDSRVDGRSWIVADSALTEIGRATSRSTPVTNISNGVVYALDGVATDHAIAMRDADGGVVVFYTHNLWPDLCPYVAPLADQPPECAAPPGPTGRAP